MREIKFRAWDKNIDKMIYADVHCLYSNGGLIDCFEDEDLMQYTGLKDKNGKEIYEGDIIYYWANDSKKVASMEAIRYVECFTVEDDHRIEVLDSKYMEVIGNIYENADLIKE